MTRKYLKRNIIKLKLKKKIKTRAYIDVVFFYIINTPLFKKKYSTWVWTHLNVSNTFARFFFFSIIYFDDDDDDIVSVRYRWSLDTSYKYKDGRSFAARTFKNKEKKLQHVAYFSRANNKRGETRKITWNIIIYVGKRRR